MREKFNMSKEPKQVGCHFLLQKTLKWPSNVFFFLKYIKRCLASFIKGKYKCKTTPNAIFTWLDG